MSDLMYKLANHEQKHINPIDGSHFLIVMYMILGIICMEFFTYQPYKVIVAAITFAIMYGIQYAQRLSEKLLNDDEKNRAKRRVKGYKISLETVYEMS